MKTETKNVFIKKLDEAKTEAAQQAIVDEFMQTSSEMSEEEERLETLEDLLGKQIDMQVQFNYLSNVDADNGILLEYNQKIIDELQNQIREVEELIKENNNGKKKY